MIGRLIDEHWPQQNRALQYSGLGQHHGGSNVGTIGVAEREYAAGVEAVGDGRRANEASELLSSRPHFPGIEYTFRYPSKKSRRTVLQHISARAQDRGAGSNGLTDTDQIVFVAARAMENEESLTRSGIRCRHETVNEAKIFGHALGPRSSSGMRMLGSSASISKRRGSNQSGSFSD